MIDFSATTIQQLSITYVGNKSRYEGVSIPRQVLVPVHAYAHELLLATFFKPFNTTEQFFYFHHEDDVSHNLAYQRCVEIFDSPEVMPQSAARLTAQLYESMLSPRANGGEFIIALFDDVALNGEKCSAIGLFKVNHKDPFFRVEKTAESFTLQVSEGILSGKMETAAIIFGVDEADGYRICALDTVSRKDEMSFWKDDFLRIRPVEDHFFNTTHYMKLAGEFITQHAPRKLGIDRPEQVDWLNRTAHYFKDNTAFEVDHFTEQLFDAPEHQDAFKNFKTEYTQKNALPLEDKFDISRQAVKREAKIFKSVIRLDKNFHIYVHGRRDLIERGYDAVKGKKYYKVYFDDET